MLREFDYYAPESIEEALALLSEGDKIRAIKAGGTDLLVNLKKDLIRVEEIVDLSRIKQLSELRLNEQGLLIGAGVTVNALLESEEVSKAYPLLIEAGRKLASHQIRNRATVVGNICNASPGADMAPALLVLGTEVLVTGLEGERVIPLEDFFTGVKRTALKKGELVRGLQVRSQPEDTVARYFKKSRIKGPDLSAAGVAGLLSHQAEKLVFAYGALAPTPLLLDFSQEFTVIKSNLAEGLNRILTGVADRVSPITDVRSTEEYRKRIARVYTKRIILELWGEGEV